MVQRKINLPEWLTAGVAFVYYWVMALYKLTYAPIWQDEAMEFYCSIPVKGEITGVTKLASMYERMAHIQQQPPLYNWLMCLWLKVNEGEWWYRFSSVIFGFVAAIGIYVIIRKLCNRYMAAFCVIIYSSIYILMYYVKEASEYIVLVMFLIWLTYAFLAICEKLDAKRILVFTLLCVACMYTHYGAAFAVVPMAVCVLVIAFMRKDYASFKFGLVSFGLSGIALGLPLLYFFLIPQSDNQVSTLFSERDIIIENGNIFGDFCFSFASVFRWCLIDIDRDTEKIGVLVNVLLIVLVAVLFYVAFKTKNFFLKAFFWCNVAVFMIYYVVTKLNLYAYGWYGNRYNMFIFPLWFLLIAISLYEFVQLLKNSDYAVISKASRLVGLCLVLGGFLYCLYGDYRISNHWWKMDLRTVVREWYDLDGYETPTILDFHQRYAFVYYFTHDARYDEAQWENIVYNDEIETYSHNRSEPFQEYIRKVYDDELPDEVYLVTGQWNAFCKAFEHLGYTVEPVVDTTAKLYRAVKRTPEEMTQ
ncbi:MAG: glycosyltransferase family 39 protein [Lachnospiraceae bacterium]|nr:glycosyltransferase family 39 protein [Lachnospiraceae bacterium]